MSGYDIYVLSFRNKEREDAMRDRFKHVGIDAKIHSLDHDDPSLDRLTSIDSGAKRNIAITMSHLSMVRDFYENSSNNIGIFCENDIYISRSIKYDLSVICNEFRQLNLDTLLLSYLLTHNPKDYPGYYKPLKQGKFNYYSYPNDLWGGHCYMFSREQAKYLLDTFTLDYLAKDPKGSDWTMTKITKSGRRACLWPVLAVEEGGVETTHPGQVKFHLDCAGFLYDPLLYV